MQTQVMWALASLVGLETALENIDAQAIDDAIKTIMLLHSMILSFGGIPLLYYGDAVGMLSNLEYLADPSKRNDNRWIHRSHFDWNKAEKRDQAGTVEYKIFTALKKLIALRKETTAFADFNNRQLLSLENPNLLAFSRTDPQNKRNKVLVIANFNVESQATPINILKKNGFL